MSKESAAREADICACGLAFTFQQYHWPHCPANPDNLTKPVLKAMEAKFTKSELAAIATHGPVPDHQFGKRKNRRGKK